MNKTETILVTGATGRQGGAVARYLLKAGHKIRVLTRDPKKAAHFAKQGTEVVQGDMLDRAGLQKALQGVRGVFAMTTPFEAGMEAEVRQGIDLADAAKAAGVAHYVYSSVASADKNTGIPHFESKWKIERHIKKLGLPATILRPVFFMENFAAPWLWPSVQQGKIILPMKPTVPLQMIALDDIGAFGASAFMKPEIFLGQAIDLAGDRKTMPEAAAALSSALGKTVTFQEMPMDQAEKTMGRDFALMFKWFNEVGYSVDTQELERKYGLPLTPFDQVLRQIAWPKAA